MHVKIEDPVLVYVRDNVLSGGHYPKINPDGTNKTPTRSGGVLFRTEYNTLSRLLYGYLPKTIEDIPPKYLFLMILLPFHDFRKEKNVLQANRILTFQVLRSNPLLADFKLQ